MKDTGYAIRCPHCAKWNIWPEKDPGNVAVEQEEFNEIIKGLDQASKEGKPWDYKHQKLIRCTRPSWSCPSSFEAIVFKSREDMKSCLQRVPEEWPFKRDFRLYKANCIDRWENRYWTIMFCAPPFRRMRDTELESLMDRELLSRLIAGMSVEINSVLTIFGANIFEPPGRDPEVFWMPIEGYSQERRLTPPRFNKFCECVRSIETTKLIEEFRAQKYNVHNCPIGYGHDGQCADREGLPACMREHGGDWTHCPAFMRKREEISPCYKSDLRFIDKFLNTNEEEPLNIKICPAGFTEIAFPIIVHGHLVGVAMGGQVFFNPEDIVDVKDFVKKHKFLAGHEDELEKANKSLISEETKLRENQNPRFFLNRKELDNRLELLRKNIERITEMANARYRDIRKRSEVVFREELLEFFQNHKNEPDFFDHDIKHILKRMREFWAFKDVFLVVYSYTSKNISVISMSSIDKGETSYGLPGKKVGMADPTYKQTHPIRYLYRRSAQRNVFDPLVKNLLSIFNKISREGEFSADMADLTHGNHLFVLVPFYDEVYAFIFRVRNEANVSRLERPARGDISELCQEIILRVCTEVVYEFGDIWYREASKQTVKLDALRVFSASNAHKINNQLFAARGVLRRQREANREFVGIEELESSIEKIGLICSDFSRLVTDQPLNLQNVNVQTLIKREVAHYEHAAQERHIDFFIPESLPRCIWDPIKIGQVISELLENAINYSPPNSKISISVEYFKKDTIEMIRITVYNDGAGVEHANKSRIFQRFFSTQSQRAGLGLAIVAKIVERHMGTIREVGEPNRNAKFVIELPKQVKEEL